MENYYTLDPYFFIPFFAIILFLTIFQLLKVSTRRRKVTVPSKMELKVGQSVLVSESPTRYWATVTQLLGKGPVLQTIEVQQLPWHKAAWCWIAQLWKR